MSALSPAVDRASRPVEVMRTPRTLDIEITSRCNLRCRYCYFYGNDAVSYGDLPAEEWLAFFGELSRASVMSVTLCGGEPFAREDLGELVEGLVAGGMRFAILTNGTLVTAETARHLAAAKRCDFVQVSVDGPGPEAHDTLRGRGSFDRAVAGIAALRAAGLPVTVRVTVHRGNVDALEETALFLLEELGLPSFSVNSAGFLGTCRSGGDEILLDTWSRGQAIETLLRLDSRFPGRIVASAGPLAEGKGWRRMMEAESQGAPPFPDGGRLTGCRCTMSSLAVRADGSYIPCIMLPHLVLGKVSDNPLVDVWQGSAILEGMRRRHTVALDRFAECSSCRWQAYCTGNCPALAFAKTGELDRPSPDGCLRRYRDDGGLLPFTGETVL